MAGEAKLRPGQVVTFEHTDPVLGRTLKDVGVVWAVGETVQIRPLSSTVLAVDPANVAPVSADEVQAAE